jgi:transcriptional regulator with XRE-family HTH domain
MNSEWFGGRLRELRIAAGLSQRELAEKTGLTTGAIAKLERSERKPTWETVLILSEVLKVTPNDFAQEAEPKEPVGPGRPRKEPTEPPAPKRPVGRPRKGATGEEPKGRRKK